MPNSKRKGVLVMEKTYRECINEKCPFIVKHNGNKFRTQSEEIPYHCPHCRRTIPPFSSEPNLEKPTQPGKKSIKKNIGGIIMETKSWNWKRIGFIAAALVAILLFVYFFNFFKNSWEGILSLCGLGAIIIGTSILFLNETKKELPANALKTGIWLNRAGATALAIALIFGFFIPNFSPIDPVDIESEPTAIESETETESEPIILIPTTPSIFAMIGTEEFGNQGEYLKTELGERMTFTNRKVVVPDKAWNDPLTETELKSVETTWVTIKIDIPEGMVGTVFAGGLEQGTNRYENGVLLTLDPGSYEFNLRNGEVVLWYPSQDEYKTNDIVRIIDQIKNGNFDIKSELQFFGVTADLLPSIPDDLVVERNVQIINNLEPITTK